MSAVCIIQWMTFQFQCLVYHYIKWKLSFCELFIVIEKIGKSDLRPLSSTHTHTQTHRHELGGLVGWGCVPQLTRHTYVRLGLLRIGLREREPDRDGYGQGDRQVEDKEDTDSVRTGSRETSWDNERQSTTHEDGCANRKSKARNTRIGLAKEYCGRAKSVHHVAVAESCEGLGVDSTGTGRLDTVSTRLSKSNCMDEATCWNTSKISIYTDILGLGWSWERDEENVSIRIFRQLRKETYNQKWTRISSPADLQRFQDPRNWYKFSGVTWTIFFCRK